MKSNAVKIITVLLLVGILFFIIKSILGNRPGVVNDPGGFLNAFFPWLSAREGGLVESGAGGDYKLKTAPCNIVRNGRTFYHPRANRGVSYSNYVKYAPKFGYPVNCTIFGDMPEDLWRQIVRTLLIDKGLRFTSNIVLATYVGGWYWGSGSISLGNIAKIRNILKSSSDNLVKLDKLIALRKQHFMSLHNNDPEHFPMSLIEAYNHRADLFRELALNYI